ncbi:Tim10/DDP family zinc finger [Macleaya cordata]|uniref:Tim10/DDP family zinc finger n=1 Tax=Macleaya cordata TaxID=56857 RepID=A0A200R4U4_MACCD|nr:Tim10/DDP family zinc finger [Macleaya cordata]
MAANNAAQAAFEREQIFGMAEKEMEYRVDLFNRLTQTCFNKCIEKRYKESELNMGENSCIDRCVSKYWQVTNLVGQLLGSNRPPMNFHLLNSLLGSQEGEDSNWVKFDASDSQLLLRQLSLKGSLRMFGLVGESTSITLNQLVYLPGHPPPPHILNCELNGRLYLFSNHGGIYPADGLSVQDSTVSAFVNSLREWGNTITTSLTESDGYTNPAHTQGLGHSL